MHLSRHGHGHHGPAILRRFARGEHGRRGSHHGEHGGGRSGLGRFFAHGDLRLVILNLIAEKPRHGYEIIKAIEERVGGVYSPSPGVIYPTLTLLEELGYVTVSIPGDGKKLHAITPQGQAFLDANRPALDVLLARMAESARARDDGFPEISRAVERLRHVIRLRLSRLPMTEAQAIALTAILEDTAAKVEAV